MSLNVLRFFGYNKIPAALSSFRVEEVPSSFLYPDNRELAETLKGWGFTETLTSSLVSESACASFGVEADQLVKLSNPLSQDETVLRPLLIPNLLKAIQTNVNHQRESVFLFEEGARHLMNRAIDKPVEERALAFVGYGELSSKTWNAESREIDFFYLKSYFEGINQKLGGEYTLKLEQARPFLHPHQSFSVHQNGNQMGWGGVLHPEMAGRFDLNRSCIVFEIQLDSRRKAVLQFKEFSKFPFVERDIAVLIDKTVPWSRIAEIVHEMGGPLLQEVKPFDLFSGGSMDASKKSVAFRCRLQHDQKTLSETDITQTIDRIKSALTERCGAQLR
jgi:phenylalanyl-tRNA synthetase beta chain